MSGYSSAEYSRSDDVEVDGEHTVGRHGEDVGDGQSCEDHVGGRVHVFAGQHYDVENVAHYAEHTHTTRQVTVDKLAKYMYRLNS